MQSYVVAMVSVPKQVLAETRLLLSNHTDPSPFAKPFHVIVHELVIELERSTTRKKKERGDIHVLMAVPFRQKGKRGDKRINPGAPSNIFACLWCIVTSQSAEREPNCYRYDRRNVLACVTRLAPQISDDAPIYSFAMQLQATSSPS